MIFHESNKSGGMNRHTVFTTGKTDTVGKKKET